MLQLPNEIAATRVIDRYSITAASFNSFDIRQIHLHDSSRELLPSSCCFIEFFGTLGDIEGGCSNISEDSRRKVNWFFAQGYDGGQTAATIESMVANFGHTLKEKGVMKQSEAEFLDLGVFLFQLGACPIQIHTYLIFR